MDVPGLFSGISPTAFKEESKGGPVIVRQLLGFLRHRKMSFLSIFGHV
jgi:hypothetical protein